MKLAAVLQRSVGTLAMVLVSAGTVLGATTQAIPQPAQSSLTIDPNLNASESIGKLAGQVVDVLLALAGAAAVIFMIYYGIMYITSAGNADRLKSARAGIINAIIGIVVIVAAYFIIQLSVNIGAAVNNTKTN